MNEVTVLSAAGELTGRALGNGVRAVRRSTVALSRSGGAAGLAAARAAGRQPPTSRASAAAPHPLALRR